MSSTGEIKRTVVKIIQGDLSKRKEKHGKINSSQIIYIGIIKKKSKNTTLKVYFITMYDY